MIYLGIDPGVNGGFAYQREYDQPRKIRGCNVSGEVWTHKMPETVTQIWSNLLWLKSIKDETYAVVEEQLPRPTHWQDKQTREPRESVLASTCKLYGNYQRITTSLSIYQWEVGLLKWDVIPPKQWQCSLNITPKRKSETKGDWKNKLKRIAQRLFPGETVTLWNADALLLCEFAKRLCEGDIRL